MSKETKQAILSAIGIVLVMLAHFGLFYLLICLLADI